MRQATARSMNGCSQPEAIPQSKEQILHLVRIDDVPDFEKCGWVKTGSSLGGYHDTQGVLMQWPHGEPLRKPQR